MRLRPFQPLFGLCSVQRVENLLSTRCANNALQIRQGGQGGEGEEHDWKGV